MAQRHHTLRVFMVLLTIAFVSVRIESCSTEKLRSGNSDAIDTANKHITALYKTSGELLARIECLESRLAKRKRVCK